jgi:hypothetical protein
MMGDETVFRSCAREMLLLQIFQLAEKIAFSYVA